MPDIDGTFIRGLLAAWLHQQAEYTATFHPPVASFLRTASVDVTYLDGDDPRLVAIAENQRRAGSIAVTHGMFDPGGAPFLAIERMKDHHGSIPSLDAFLLSLAPPHH
jgi:hypothetical protein